MDAAPYYSPTYFAASYFYGAADAAPTSAGTGLITYNAPTYFAPTYFYGSSSPTTSIGLQPYNAPTYFAPSYFYGPTTLTSSTGLQPYNAPTYFAPSYFYGPSISTSSTGMIPYNAPTYFTPYYFYWPSSTGLVNPIVPNPTSPVGGDQDSYCALVELLRATGVFEDVIFGASTQRSQAGADTYPLAVLTPKGWEESDDFDPSSIVRRETFSITVVIKSEDDLPQFDRLDYLAFAIKRTVDRSDLNGTCMPALTRIRSGHYDFAGHYPEQSIGLDGEFSTIIAPLFNVQVPS